MPRSRKTVFLLGAGASFASEHELPLMRTFFDDPSLRSEIRSFLEWYYPAGAAPNLEEVLTHLYLSRERLQYWTDLPRGTSEEGGCTFDMVLQYVVLRLSNSKGDPCARHVALFEDMGDQDTVITLNYDLVADRALQHCAPRPKDTPSRSRVEKMWRLLGYRGPPIEERSIFSMGPHQEPTGFYLKLHGAINWLRCRDPACRSEVRVPPEPDSLEFVTAATGNCDRCGSALEPLIVPPTAAKTKVIRERIQKMWTRSMWELAQATTIVVWGISFAPSDADLRWLLRVSTRSRHARPDVHVINPDSNAANTALGLLAPVASSHVWNDVDDYLAYRSSHESS